jgi:uncharacterized protein with LGFP repeats
MWNRAGWEKGVLGMKKGGKRVLCVPAPLGYGASGYGESIPAGDSFNNAHSTTLLKWRGGLVLAWGCHVAAYGWCVASWAAIQTAFERQDVTFALS